MNTDTRALYNVIKKKHKKTTIFCDATGGIARKIVRENGEKSKRIFLYTFVIADDFEIPLYSMLSEVHTMSHVTYWFHEFIRLYNDIPNEFVCDMSTVLLNAAAKSFAGCANIDDYVNWLFNVVKHSNNYGRNIKCFIRIDVAHFVKNLASCESLKCKSSDQKQFYVRATCLMIKCTSLPLAEKILTSILIVAKSSAKGEAFKAHKQYIDDLISNDVSDDDIPNVSNEFQNEVGHIMDGENAIESNSIKEWLTTLQRSSAGEALENSDGIENNDLENPQFVKFLMHLCETLVIWSGVAAKHFDSTVTASSAHVENYFKHLKKYLEKLIPGRADEIVAAHIEIIDGILIDGSQKYIEFVDAAGGKSKFIEDCPQDKSTAVEENISLSNENEENVVESLNEMIEVNDFSNRISNVSTSMAACIACQNGNLPDGGHRCTKCSRFVHALEGCSKSCGEEEGYGQKRICVACFAASGATAIEKPRQVASNGAAKSNSISISKQLRETEKWTGKTRSSKSYLAPVKNWNINKKVQNKPKISMLINGNSITTVQTVGKRKVKLRNTCGPDSILQVI